MLSLHVVLSQNGILPELRPTYELFYSEIVLTISRGHVHRVDRRRRQALALVKLVRRSHGNFASLNKRFVDVLVVVVLTMVAEVDHGTKREAQPLGCWLYCIRRGERAGTSTKAGVGTKCLRRF